MISRFNFHYRIVNIIKKIQKNLKTSFRHYFYPNRDEIGLEREKKIVVPNSVPTRPWLEKSQKKIKKIQKIKNHHSGIISIQTEMRKAEKGRKIF